MIDRDIKILKIKPDPECKACGGSGEVTDWVPYGIGNTAMNTLCACVEEQADEDAEIELDLSDYCSGPDPFDDIEIPDLDNLYDLRHDLTTEREELERHPRDCDCPYCCGDPDNF